MNVPTRTLIETSLGVNQVVIYCGSRAEIKETIKLLSDSEVMYLNRFPISELLENDLPRPVYIIINRDKVAHYVTEYNGEDYYLAYNLVEDRWNKALENAQKTLAWLISLDDIVGAQFVTNYIVLYRKGNRTDMLLSEMEEM